MLGSQFHDWWSWRPSCSFAAQWFMHVATVNTCKAYMCSQFHDWCLWRQRALAKHTFLLQLHVFATIDHAPTPDSGLMLTATVSTCKAFSISQLHDWCVWRHWSLVKHIVATASNGKTSSVSLLLLPLLLVLLLLPLLLVNHPVAYFDSQQL